MSDQERLATIDMTIERLNEEQSQLLRKRRDLEREAVNAACTAAAEVLFASDLTDDDYELSLVPAGRPGGTVVMRFLRRGGE